MEGRALDRDPRQGWAFMVPLLGAVAAAQLSANQDTGRAPYLVLGLAAGAAWELLYRRDLVPRLTVPLALGGLAVAIAVATGDPITLGETAAETNARLIYFFGVLCGLVLAEQYLRRQDRRAGRLSPEEEPGTSRGSASR